MRCITTAQCKTLLGLSVTTYDTAIAAAIPKIDAIVRRLTRGRYNLFVTGTTTSGTTGMLISEVKAASGLPIYVAGSFSWSSDGGPLVDCLEIGMQISGTGIAADSHIVDIYPDGGTIDGVEYVGAAIELSADATASGRVEAQTAIPVDLQYVIAGGVWWLVQNNPTTPKDDTWVSRSMGPLSITRNASDTQIDGGSGMPLWFVKALPSFMGAF